MKYLYSLSKFIVVASLIFLMPFVAIAQVNTSFIVNTNSGCPNPLLIILEDASTSSAGTINSWSWQMTGPTGFNPVMGSTDQLTVPLTIPGLYTVSLTTCDNLNNCNTSTEVDYIEVFDVPVFDYVVSPLSGCFPQEICFDGTIDPVCGTISSILFDVRDGPVISNQEDFCHTYSASGLYSDFVVSVENSCGCVTTEIVNEVVEVYQPAIAGFSTPETTSCIAPFTVNFNNTSQGSGNMTYEWNIPGEVVADNSENLSYTFSTGSYDVELIVTDENGCSDTLLRPNYINVQPPTVDFTVIDTIVCQNEMVSFVNNSTAGAISWTWNIENFGTFLDENPIVSIPTTGFYDVQLIADYGNGCIDSISYIDFIEIIDIPVNSYTVSDSGSCILPHTTTFESTSTNSVNTFWQFENGVPATFSGQGPFDIAYNNYGSFGVTMTDTAANGCISTSSFQDVISIQELAIDIIPDTVDGCVPLEVNFDVVVNSPEMITGYNWNIPGSDILNSSSDMPTAIYSVDGCYDVELEVTTISGCTATDLEIDMICVGSPPIASFTVDPTEVCYGVDEACFTFTGSGADFVVWNYGEGVIEVLGAGSIPCHVYEDDTGFYSPSIIALDNNCPSDTFILVDEIYVNGPIAAFRDSVVCADPFTYYFFDESRIADSISWHVGTPVNGASDVTNESNPIVTYPGPGMYTILLEAFNFTTGCIHERQININIVTPDAEFAMSDTVGCVPSDIVFENESQFQNGNTTWGFYQGTDESMAIVVQGDSVSQNYDQAGDYSFYMINRVGNGCRDTIIRENFIHIHDVEAGFTADILAGCADLEVNFTDTSFTLNGSTITNWDWNFGVLAFDGDTADIQDPTYTYVDGGVYTVSLLVEDDFGCTDVVSVPNYITVNDPLASFSISEDFICSEELISATDASVGTMLSYDWQFLNGMPSSYNVDNTPPDILYNNEGVQNLSLTVTDNLGCTDDTTLVLSVFDVIADGFADQDSSNCPNPPFLVNFTNASSNNVDSTDVFWDFGNGVTSVGFEPSALYTVAGEYEVTLIANSQTGCADTTIVDTIFVGGPWGDMRILSDDLEGCVCHEIEFEVQVFNAVDPYILLGDGSSVLINPMGNPMDTLIDTVTVDYCQIGDFVPGLFLDDGFCSYNLFVDDTIRVDSLVIDFDFTPDSICYQGQICFDSNSYSELLGAGDIVSYDWNFGDGAVLSDTSDLEDPCYTYTQAGTYTVSLSIENTKGCQKTLSKDVYIAQGPQVNFQFDTACLGLTTTFTDLSVLGDFPVATAFWNFGQNPQDTLRINANPANTTFTFDNFGTYNVALTVEDAHGCIQGINQVVTVYDNPVADFTVAPLCIDIASVFTGNATQGANNPNASVDFNWNFDDGAGFENGTLIDNYTYTTAGIYDVGFAIADAHGCVDTATNTIELLPSPVADIMIADDEVCVGENFSVDGSNSSIPTPTGTYQWDFDFDTGIDANGAIQNNISYADSADRNILLIVTDENNCVDSAFAVVTVFELPTVNFEFDTACLDLETNFVDVSTSIDGNIISSLWDFDQNVADTLFANSSPLSTTFIYNNFGNYNVSLAVVDDNACQNSLAQNVIVYDNPTASFTVAPLCLDVASNFTGNVAQGANNPNAVVDFNWNFDDGVGFESGTLLDDYIYTTAGIYDVGLAIADAHGCVDTIVNSIELLPSPVADIMLSDNEVCIGEDFSTDGNGSFFATPTATYQWDFDFDTGIDANGVVQNNISYTDSVDRTILLIVTDENNCVDSVVASVTVFQLPQAAFVVSPACENIPFDLTDASIEGDAPITNYDWSIDNVVTTTGGVNTLELNYPTNDTIEAQLTITDANGCMATSTIDTIIIEQQPNFDLLIDDIQLCPRTIYEFSVADTNMVQFFGGVDSFYFTPNTGLTVVDSLVSIDVNSDITYTMVGVGDLGQCPADSAGNDFVVNIVTDPFVEINAFPNPLVQGATADIDVVITPFNSTDTLNWLAPQSESLNTNIGLNVEATPMVETTYPMQLVYYEDEFRCVLDTSVTINLITECTTDLIYIPNVFTPNNDTKNDEFKFSGYGIERVTFLRIFDRWGKMVYEGTDINFVNGEMSSGWEGDVNGGKATNSGVFVYMYEAICLNGGIIKGSGNITVIK